MIFGRSDRDASGLITIIPSLAKLDGPQLNLQTTNGSAVISWPTNATGLSLESTGNLAGGWAPVTNLPTAVGNQFVITNPVVTGSQFYRLRNF